MAISATPPATPSPLGRRGSPASSWRGSRPELDPWSISRSSSRSCERIVQPSPRASPYGWAGPANPGSPRSTAPAYSGELQRGTNRSESPNISIRARVSYGIDAEDEDPVIYLASSTTLQRTRSSSPIYSVNAPACSADLEGYNAEDDELVPELLDVAAPSAPACHEQLVRDDSESPEEPRRGRTRSRNNTDVLIASGPGRLCSADDPPTPPGPQFPFPAHSVNDPTTCIVAEEESSEVLESDNMDQLHSIHQDQTAQGKPPTLMSMELPASRTEHKQPLVNVNIEHSISLVEEVPRETDERLPLLPRMIPVSAASTSRVVVKSSTLKNNNTMHRKSQGIAHAVVGWSEYILPDHTVYYFHQSLRIVAEVDLRNSKKLEGVVEFINTYELNQLPSGWELWLRDNSKLSSEIVIAATWVSHQGKILTLELPNVAAREIVIGLPEGERVDMEYQYWTYVESHPAHRPLPIHANAEALDVLTWCYTGYLLPFERNIPSAFSLQECQELIALLKIVTNGKASHTIEQNRMIARVHLRQLEAQWQQFYFGEANTLPGGLKNRKQGRITFRRAVLLIVASIFCLGIPYLFIKPQNHYRSDEESALPRRRSVLIICACAFPVAAIILVTSSMIITLPDLDDFARSSGLISMLFSVLSMIASVRTPFKLDTASEPTLVSDSDEVSRFRRSIVVSLPVVFIAWSVMVLIVGIMLYAFRGTTLTSNVIGG